MCVYVNGYLVIAEKTNVKLLSMYANVHGPGATSGAHVITLGHGTDPPAGYYPSPKRICQHWLSVSGTPVFHLGQSECLVASRDFVALCVCVCSRLFANGVVFLCVLWSINSSAEFSLNNCLFNATSSQDVPFS